jgi:hypothetical protein
VLAGDAVKKLKIVGTSSQDSTISNGTNSGSSSSHFGSNGINNPYHDNEKEVINLCDENENIIYDTINNIIIPNNHIKKERIKDSENRTLNIIHTNRKQLDNLNNNDAKIENSIDPPNNVNMIGKKKRLVSRKSM